MTSLHCHPNYIIYAQFDLKNILSENLFHKAEKLMTIVEDTLNKDVKPFCRLPDGYHIQCIYADLHKYISFNFHIGSDCMRNISELMFIFAAASSALPDMNVTALTLHMRLASANH